MNSENLIEGLTGQLRLILPDLHLACAIFMMINWAWVYSRTMIASTGTNVDYSPLIRSIVCMLVVFNYEEVFYLISLPMDAFAELVIPLENDQVMAHLDHMSTALKQAVDAKYQDATGAPKSLNPFEALFAAGEQIQSMFAWLFIIVSQGIGMIVRAIMSKIQVVFTAFLFFTGPIAFTLSVLPGFGDTFKTWFKWLVTAKLLILSLGIIDLIVIYTDENIINEKLAIAQNPNTAAKMSGVFDIVVLNLVFISAYLLAPLLTAIYAGGSAAIGAFVNKSVAGAAAVGSFAFRGATSMLGAKGGSSGGGSQFIPSPAALPSVLVQYTDSSSNSNGNASLNNPTGTTSNRVS